MSTVTGKKGEIVFRTRGETHNNVTVLITPGDLGQRLKPFVFLDNFQLKNTRSCKNFAMHPHSGIASLTYLFEGEMSYEDTTGKTGLLPAGGLGWLNAGSGVWHSDLIVGGSFASGLQLWIALSSGEESAAPRSIYLMPSDIPTIGPAQLLLGKYADWSSQIPTSGDITYLAVKLKKGERWSYTPPVGHDVIWLAMNSGQLRLGNVVSAGELVVFRPSSQAITLVSRGDSSFVLGSAVKHPHHLILGYASVHTSEETLASAESEISRIGGQWREDGLIE
jgi:redox-sensitive bicupin YhaK (pirin superfamily)